MTNPDVTKAVRPSAELAARVELNRASLVDALRAAEAAYWRLERWATKGKP